MTHSETITRDTIWALPLGAAVGAGLGGLELAGQVAFCAALFALNLKLLRVLTQAYLARAAAGQGPGLVGLLLSTKLVVSLVVFGALLQVLSPVALVIGVATVLMVAAASGALRTPIASLPVESR